MSPFCQRATSRGSISFTRMLPKHGRAFPSIMYFFVIQACSRSLGRTSRE
jgi:hypothetical protein